MHNAHVAENTHKVLTLNLCLIENPSGAYMREGSNAFDIAPSAVETWKQDPGPDRVSRMHDL
jgi:hypothetical protein